MLEEVGKGRTAGNDAIIAMTVVTRMVHGDKAVEWSDSDLDLKSQQDFLIRFEGESIERRS